MTVFVLHLLALSVSCVSIVLKFIVIIFSMSMSGIPKKACLFSATTRNFQIVCLLLCCNFTLHMPNCVTVVLLCVFNCMLLFLLAANCSFVAIGNKFYTCVKTFPSVHVYTLYGTTIEARSGDVFRFAVVTKCFSLK